jgi:hypothetical protein
MITFIHSSISRIKSNSKKVAAFAVFFCIIVLFTSVNFADARSKLLTTTKLLDSMNTVTYTNPAYVDPSQVSKTASKTSTAQPTGLSQSNVKNDTQALADPYDYKQPSPRTLNLLGLIALLSECLGFLLASGAINFHAFQKNSATRPVGRFFSERKLSRKA